MWNKSKDKEKKKFTSIRYFKIWSSSETRIADIMNAATREMISNILEEFEYRVGIC